MIGHLNGTNQIDDVFLFQGPCDQLVTTKEQSG